MGIEPNPARVEHVWAPEELGRHRWVRKFGALLYIFFCFEIGVFLFLFPWTDWWHKSFFAGLTPGWYEFWISPFVRGAISGLGVIDLCISFSELIRLRRFAGVEPPDDADGPDHRTS